MDNSNIQRLVDQVNNDVALQGRFKSISDQADFDALVSELGYELTYADFTDAELSDSELTEVAGGQVAGFTSIDIRDTRYRPGTTDW